MDRRMMYVNMFPYTFVQKNSMTPYNRKALARLSARNKSLKKSSVVKRKVSSATYVELKDLTDFSSDSPDLQKLLVEAGETLRQTTEASGVSVFIFDTDLDEIVRISNGLRYKVAEKETIAQYVAMYKTYVMVDDVRYDKRFPKGIGRNDHLIKAVLCVPVLTPDNDLFAIFELSKEVFENAFTEDDVKIIVVLAGWMGAAVHQNLQRISMKKQETLHGFLLDITHNFFQRKMNEDTMVTKLISYAKDKLNVQTARFFIIDKESEEMFAIVYEESIDPYLFRMVKKNLKIKPLVKDRGAITIVCRTGLTINVRDLSKDARLEREPRLRNGKDINSMLCLPINGSGSAILGIFQMLNKNHGYFNKNDEALLNIFAQYTSCCLQFNIVNNRLKKQTTLGKIYEDLLNLHLKPCPHEYDNFIKYPNIKVPTLTDFDWYVTDSLLNSMPQLAVAMIVELCNDHNEIHRDNLIRFMLTCRRLYRKNYYHNFEHAFNFLHCMFAILKRNKHRFSEIEIKALLIASICHDIDHGGVTNNHLMLTNDIMYQLYPESTWENHHYRVTANLIQQLPLFRSFSRTDFKAFMQETKEAILATDLKVFFKNRLILMPLLNKDDFDTFNDDHRFLLKSIMMTVCDISGMCLPFAIAKRIAENVYREFYNQGDVEKKLGHPQLPMMDREKQDKIPEEQIQFLSVVVLPATEMLKTMLPNTSQLYDSALVLRQSWQDLVDAHKGIPKIE